MRVKDLLDGRSLTTFLLMVASQWRLAMGSKVQSERTAEDLKRILDRVSLKYLGRLLPEVSIEWGRRYRKPKVKRKHIYLGWYFWTEKLIRIHSVLRQKWVPEFFVEYVVYHEVLHHVMSPEMKQYAMRAAKAGRQPEYHPEVFLLAEKLFKNYAKAVEWEDKNLDKLLRA